MHVLGSEFFKIYNNVEDAKVDTNRSRLLGASTCPVPLSLLSHPIPVKNYF